MFGTATNPGNAIMTVALTVAGLVVASYPVIKMIGWWIEGGAEPLIAMISIMLYLAMIVWMAAAPPAVAIIMFLLIVASAICAPIYGSVADAVQLQRMDDQKLE